MDQNFRSGFIAVVGRANVGKSTIINRLTGEKISIISNKPQTTRNRILAIRTDETSQMIFVDTPGVHNARNKLGEFMNSEARGAVGDADAVLLMVSALDQPGKYEESLIEQFRGLPAVLGINKIDLLKDKEKLLPLIEAYHALYPFTAIIPISALKKDGTKAVFDELYKLLPEGPMFYPEDQITDQPEKQIAAEIIREKVLHLFDKEVPHGTAVFIDVYKDEPKLLTIKATIYCEKNSHKSMLIGAGGSALKRVGTRARIDIEKITGKKVYLELFVKPKTDWRNKKSILDELGYKKV